MTPHPSPRIAIKVIAVQALLALTLGLFGCASGPGANPGDPLEPLNREVTRFNDGLDRAILKPVATTYKESVPLLLRNGVTNFFNNIEDGWSFLNSVMQLRGRIAVDNYLRVVINSFFGLGGVLDVAGEIGIERHSEDFGQTLGRWGVPAGPYIVLPLLGPSTLRDTAALSVDFKGDTIKEIQHVPARNSLYALRGVEARASLLRAGELLDQAALDKYSFTRDVFLQKRRADVYTGKPLPDDADGPEKPEKPDAPDK
jgi:phospholipid-binding lipoprotein MlaA